MITATLTMLAAAALSAQPAATARRVAVLDFNASWAGGCSAAAKTSEAQREQCEMLRLFADQARIGALAVLRPPGFVVMTRENSAQILKDMGGVCSEGECEVETARLLGASVVVSGEVALMEGTYIVSLKVHDVATAALLAGGDTQAKTKLEAFGNVRAATERMLRSAGLDGTSPPAQPAVVAAAPPPAPAKTPAATPNTTATPVPTKATTTTTTTTTTPTPTPTPTPIATRTAPPVSVAPVGSRSRRWEVELRGGIAPVSHMPVRPAELQMSSSTMVELRVGYRLSPALMLQLSAGRLESAEGRFDYPSGAPSAYLLFDWKANHGALGVVWSPRALGYFSVGADLGIAYERVSFGSSTGDNMGKQGPGLLFATELRFDYPLGAWTLGARAGVLTSAGGYDAQLSPGIGANAEFGGSVVLFPLSAAVAYRF